MPRQDYQILPTLAEIQNVLAVISLILLAAGLLCCIPLLLDWTVASWRRRHPRGTDEPQVIEHRPVSLTAPAVKGFERPNVVAFERRMREAVARNGDTRR